nr:LysR substrate-binding domain-containing protein [Stenotrophomonas daejeonensis]
MPRRSPRAPRAGQATRVRASRRLCFALHGLGIAYLPDFAIREPLSDGRLLPLLEDAIGATGVFHILWPASKHPSPKRRALVDFLSERVFPDNPQTARQ